MSQQLIGEAPGRITPLDEFVNSLEVERMAQRKLAPALFDEISGSERQAYDRITFRPRMMVDTTKLDLSLELFGQSHFAPILIGPAARQQRFHPDGELATARGAAAAKAVAVIAGESSYSLDKIAAIGPFWFQANDVEKARQGVQLGAKAICVTAPVEWAAVEKVRKAVTVPVLLKGVMTPAEAKAALQHGLNGMILSNYRGRPDPSLASPLEVLPAVAAEVAGKVPVLIDGGIRRGSDVLKALALGATAALVTRPVLWGLTTYGDRGVQQVMEMLQSELARAMAMCGLPSLQEITPAYVKVHRR
jgi:4-hydroxymandelate oxidase